MLQSITDFIKGFRSRSGSSVFVAMMVARVFSFVSQWLALQLINEKDLGNVIYAYSFYMFLLPLSGFGLNYAYLRYAALHPDTVEKDNYFIYSLYKGLKVAILFTLLLILVGYFSFNHQPNVKIYFAILSFNIITFYVLDIVKSYFRILHQNKTFAKVEIAYNIVLVILTITLGYLFKATGYSMAITLAPLLALLFFLKNIKIDFKKYQKPQEVSSEFWKFGFYSGLSGVTGQLLFAIDMILIGNMLLKPELVTHYKYVSLLPYSLLFIPSMFLMADFVKLIEDTQHQHKINTYIKNYWSFFIVVSIGILGVAFLIPELILRLFAKNLTPYVFTFQILMIGVVGVLLFRGLFGNLLASIGKSHVNFIISIASLLVNFVFNYLLIPKMGINGAAITSAVVMWVSGLLSFVLFRYYYFKK